MGSGKTTVGKILAAGLQWPFIDLDERIVAAQGRSIPEIFREHGEPSFRRIEAETLRAALAEAPPGVIALGGGAFIQEINREQLRTRGALTVFLDADPVLLFERCAAEGPGRPLLQSRESFLALYAERRPVYMTAGLIVPANGRTPQEIANEIAARIAARDAVPD